LNGAVIAVPCDACSLWSRPKHAVAARCWLCVCVWCRLPALPSWACSPALRTRTRRVPRRRSRGVPRGQVCPNGSMLSTHAPHTHTYSVAHASILRSGETTWRQERLSVVQKHPLVTRWGHFVGFCFARAFVCVHVDRPRHSRRARHFLPGPVYAHPTHQLCGGRWGCCFLSPAPTQLYVLACLSVHASQWRRRGRRLFGLSEPHAFVRRL
jgi:hypothetical protein